MSTVPVVERSGLINASKLETWEQFQQFFSSLIKIKTNDWESDCCKSKVALVLQKFSINKISVNSEWKSPRCYRQMSEVYVALGNKTFVSVLLPVYVTLYNINSNFLWQDCVSNLTL